ncbi:hypothetical protein DLH72_04055 [Candidatus Gracilibacteria bacterium]|nr:MAG: hypothetical protein DLH72_04055 [Candidatus Gracilibacteria bacterium]
METVYKAATALNGLAERDKNQKITGFNGSEKRFVELLTEIKEAYQKSYSRKTGKNLDNAEF